MDTKVQVFAHIPGCWVRDKSTGQVSFKPLHNVPYHELGTGGFIPGRYDERYEGKRFDKLRGRRLEIAERQARFWKLLNGEYDAGGGGKT